jgi:hypothetical protein
MKEVDSINETLRKMGHPSFELSDKVKNALLQFHGAILSGIDTSSMDQEAKDRKFVELMNQNKDDSQKNIEGIFKLLNDYYGKDFEKTIEGIVNAPGIAESKEMKDNVSLIANSIKSLKVKYKFFEYKYIELNIFLILFVQHVYKTLDDFVKNVLAFNTQRDETREKVVKDTLKIMINILTAADLQIEPKDFEYLTGMMDKLKTHMDKKEQEMNEKVKGLYEITTDNIAGFLDALSDATKVDMYNKLGQQDAIKKNQPYSGGMLRDHSVLSKTFYEDKGMSGGFLRGQSVLPQAFYEIDGIETAPHPNN